MIKFPPLRIKILFILLLIFSHEGKCQIMYDSIDNSNLSIRLEINNDSIDKKNAKAKHSAEFKSGKEDAKEFYSDNSAFAIAFTTSLLLPPVGLITTIAISTTEPKINKLNIPNEGLQKNDQYMKGYIQKAKRMRAGKAWIGCLTGLTFFGVAYFMFTR